MSGERQPGQHALLEGAIRTLEDVLLPELQSKWARASAIGLVGQLRYAQARAAHDSLAAQDDSLEACLGELLAAHADLRAAAEDVEPRGERSWDLREQASRLLVHARSHPGPGADAVRGSLRPLLVAQAGEDLGESGAMLAAFLAAGSVGSHGS